jgi:hypothetical protein
MDTTNILSEKKLVEQLVTPEHLSPAFIAACHCSIDKQLLEQELEYLWDDSDSTESHTKYIWGRSAETPSLRAKLPASILPCRGP